jgi:hypothetical protein
VLLFSKDGAVPFPIQKATVHRFASKLEQVELTRALESSASSSEKLPSASLLEPCGDFIVYVDETGDHGPISSEFPVFVLAFCIFRKSAYLSQVLPAVHALKFRHLGHDAVVLHEREIRKQLAPFDFLRVPARRSAFMEDLNDLIATAPFVLLAVAIDKRRQTLDSNPYSSALGVGLLHLTRYLRENNEHRLTHVVVESRGKKEDGELKDAFAALCQPSNTLEGCNLDLVFASKQHGHCGLQLADLIARPIGRNVIDPTQANRAYEILSPKFWHAPDHIGWGFHVLPSPDRCDGTDGST